MPYLWDLSNSFSNSFIDFYSYEGFHQVIYQEEWSIKLRVENGGWLESLNFFHVSRCEMLHFVTSYMKQNKSRKQTLESAQYGLEISFNVTKSLASLFQYDKIFCKVGQQQLVMMNYQLCVWFYQSETGKYFEWILIRLIDWFWRLNNFHITVI